jgi:anti-anti-sigma factor
MRWTMDLVDHTHLVTLNSCNLDASAAVEFRSSLLPRINSDTVLVIDLSLVKFADSSGIGLLCTLVDQVGLDAVSFIGINDRLRQSLARIPMLRILMTVREQAPTLLVRSA